MKLRSKWIICLIPILIFVGEARGRQSTDNSEILQGPVSLQHCIDYALLHAVNVQNSTLDEQIAQAKVKETIGIGLPQINGSASVVYNKTLQRFFGQYSDTPGAISFFPAGLAGVNNGDVLGAQNFFQLKNSGLMTMSINQIVFNGSYLVGLQAASTYKELSARTADQTKEEVVMNVMKAYYTVLVNNEREILFNANIARLDTLLNNTRALNKSGFAESIDVDRIQVSRTNLISERDKFDNLNQLSLLLLKFQMNYPLDVELELSENIETIEGEVVETDPDWQYNERPDYRVMEVNRKLQQLNIKNLKAGALPSVNAFGNLGYSTQSNTFPGIFKTNTSIEDNGTFGPDKWYGYSNFGLSVNVPIFSGLQLRHQVQQQELAMLKLENGFDAMEDAIDLQIQQATLMYENAKKTAMSQKENQELALRVASVTKIKYEQGVGSNLEVVNAENDLRTAQANYYNALYDMVIAKIDIKKAFGKLLPVTN